jgi:CHAT domain-containing protein
LLQPHEIATLDPSGKAVLLSACRTASGQVLAGEGALGLVRAFFRAGAVGVIAAPWPLHDREARALITVFAEELRLGDTLGDALTRAKRARLSAGASTIAWAGLQLHGDANFRPVAQGPPPTRIGAWNVAVCGVLLLVWFGLWCARRGEQP